MRFQEKHYGKQFRSITNLMQIVKLEYEETWVDQMVSTIYSSCCTYEIKFTITQLQCFYRCFSGSFVVGDAQTNPNYIVCHDLITFDLDNAFTIFTFVCII